MTSCRFELFWLALGVALALPLSGCSESQPDNSLLLQQQKLQYEKKMKDEMAANGIKPSEKRP